MHPENGTEPGPAVATASAHPTPRDAAHQAARLLEMAARDAELWLSEAKGEAAQLRQVAREEAEQLVAAARAEADTLLGSARSESERVRAELDAAKRHHEGRVAELERMATENREHLRQHLTELLGRVDGQGPVDDDG
jgi:cell division septum initiation protein DivIVA